MDAQIERLIQLTDRVLHMVEHDLPPEQTNIAELRKLIDELKGEPKTIFRIGMCR